MNPELVALVHRGEPMTPHKARTAVKTFKCWRPVDMTEADAVEIQDLRPDSAAEEFAQLEWQDSGGECGTEFEVCVREPTGALRTFGIRVDFAPNFFATDKPTEPVQ